MRKFTLYSLFILFLVALGTLIFGFWNARSARDFADRLGAVRQENDFGTEIGAAEKMFLSADARSSQGLREKSVELESKLREITSRSRSAETQVEQLSVSWIAKNSKEKTREYYAKTSDEAENLGKLAAFMGRTLEVSSVFEEINENANLDEIKNLIAMAREKSDSVKPDELPLEMRESGRKLLESMGIFLEKMGNVAARKNESAEELESAYADFSQKEKEFSAAMGKYISELPNLSSAEQAIDAEIEKLRKVYFVLSVKG